MAKITMVPSIDPAACDILEYANIAGSPPLSAARRISNPAQIGNGQSGICCKNCYMGPCRLTKDGQVGVCGATVETIAARNLARAIAAGSAAHSDHGRDMAFTLEAVGQGRGAGLRGPRRGQAAQWRAKHGIPTERRSKRRDCPATSPEGHRPLRPAARRAEPTVKAGADQAPGDSGKSSAWPRRGVDREVVESLHRTHMGDDQDAEHILTDAMRTALSDGWGGSMIATDISDILFGTPSPGVGTGQPGRAEGRRGQHHRPRPRADAVGDDRRRRPGPGDDRLRQEQGRQGHQPVRHLLHRQRDPDAPGHPRRPATSCSQELAMLTGAVEAMVVDVQCIMQALADLAQNFHTKFITTSPKVKITGATHIEFDEHHALDIAKQIVQHGHRQLPEPRRRRASPTRTQRPGPRLLARVHQLHAGRHVPRLLPAAERRHHRRPDPRRGGRRRLQQPAHDAGRVHTIIIRELLKNDVLVVADRLRRDRRGQVRAACSARPRLEYAGPGLREVCEAIGIPPVLHMGSCVDNSRILTVLTQMATEGGLGDDIARHPGRRHRAEWMSEKALAIAAYAAGSGAYVMIGVTAPGRFRRRG